MNICGCKVNQTTARRHQTIWRLKSSHLCVLEPACCLVLRVKKIIFITISRLVHQQLSSTTEDHGERDRLSSGLRTNTPASTAGGNKHRTHRNHKHTNPTVKRAAEQLLWRLTAGGRWRSVSCSSWSLLSPTGNTLNVLLMNYTENKSPFSQVFIRIHNKSQVKSKKSQ